MYELVKKKSLGIKIIFTIISLFILTSVLKIIFKEPTVSINDQLVKVANEINKHAPIIVDSVTRLDNVTAVTGNKFQYNYTIINAQTGNMDTTILISNTKEYITNMLKTNPKSAYFRENNVDIIVRYSDQKGVYLCSFLISHTDY